MAWKRIGRYWWLMVLVAGLMVGGCELGDDDDDDESDTSGGGGGDTEQSADTQEDKDETDETDTSEEDNADDTGDVSLGSVKWLHSNVSGWDQTANLSVSFSGGMIRLNYDKAKEWPSVNVDGTDVNANPWVFVKLNGRWYGATFEWLRPGQTSKPTTTVNGDHIKRSPLDSWSPVSGERYGFMVSGLARTDVRNVKERSNVVMATWP